MKKIGKKICSFYIRLILIGAVLCSLSMNVTLSQEMGITASVDSTEIGDQDQLQLTVEVSGEGSRKIKTIALPSLKNLRVVAGPSVSTRFQWINGVSSSSKSFTYVLIPEKVGEAVIPSISVKLEGSIYKTQPIKITVVKGTRKRKIEKERPFFPDVFERRRDRESVEAEITVKAEVDKQKVFQGEQLELSYKAYSTNLIIDIDAREMPSYEGFWVEDLNVDPNPRVVQKNGKRYYEYTFIRKLLFPSTPGNKTIEPLTFAISIRERSRDFFEDFLGSNVRKVYRRTEPISVNILPLPEKGKPEDFNGAVGDFHVNVEMDKEECSVNDAISVKVTIEGYGNLKGISPIKFEEVTDFKIYEPEVIEETAFERNRMKSKKVWDYIFVPLAPGRQEIPKITFSFFNPAKGVYESSTTDSKVLLVKKGAIEMPSVASPIPKGEIKPLRRDIHFIKPLKGEIENRGQFLYENKWFYILLVLPLFFTPAVIGFSLRREKIRTEAGIVRLRKSYKNASRGLRRAKKLLKKGDTNSSLQELSGLMARYIADKFNLSPSGLTYEKIEEMLDENNISEEMIRRFRMTLEKCDFTRFSKDSINADHVVHLLKEAEDSILELEKIL